MKHFCRSLLGPLALPEIMVTIATLPLLGRSSTMSIPLGLKCYKWIEGSWNNLTVFELWTLSRLRGFEKEDQGSKRECWWGLSGR